jgi:hypothetical protein
MTAELEPRDLDDLLSRALAVDLTADARSRIRARLDAAPAARAGGRRRPRTRTIVALGLAAALLVAGTATGVHYLGEWGPVDHPATVAEIEAEITAAMADNGLPPGYSYPVAQIRAAAEMEGGRAQHVGTLNVQQHYMCAWTDYWLAATSAADESHVAAALSRIEAFPKLMLIGDPRFAMDSIRDEIAQVVAGAKAGDAAPVQELWGAACSDAMVIRP